MSATSDISQSKEGIVPVPGFKMGLGKGTTEFGYVEGNALAPVVANWTTKFLLQKDNGKEANIQIQGDFPVLEGHFVAAVWAANKKTDTEYIVALVNHTLGTSYISDAVYCLPETRMRVRLAALAVGALVALYFNFGLLSGTLDASINWFFAIAGGLSVGVVSMSYFNSLFLKPFTANKVKRKLKPYLAEILKVRNK